MKWLLSALQGEEAGRPQGLSLLQLQQATDHGTALVFIGSSDTSLSIEASRRREIAQTAQMRALYLQAGLKWLSKCLAAAGVVHLPLKGPVLGARIYGKPWTRPSADLDLLVAPERLAAAQGALEAAGYDFPDSANEPGHFHLTGVHPSRPTVELHFQAARGLTRAIGYADLAAGSSPVKGEPLEGLLQPSHGRLPSPAAEYLYLIAHGASHQWEKAIWLWDLHLFASAYPKLAQPVEQLARKWRLLRLYGHTQSLLRAHGLRSLSSRAQGPLFPPATLLRGIEGQLRSPGISPVQQGCLRAFYGALLADEPLGAARVTGLAFSRLLRR